MVSKDIVQEAYNQSVRDQELAYKQNPSRFLKGLTKFIEKRFLKCDGKVPVITDKPLKGPIPNEAAGLQLK